MASIDLFTTQENIEYLTNKIGNDANITEKSLLIFAGKCGVRSNSRAERVTEESWKEVRALNRRFLSSYEPTASSYTDDISQSQVLFAVGGAPVSFQNTDDAWDHGRSDRTVEQVRAEFMARDGTNLFTRPTNRRKMKVWQYNSKLTNVIDASVLGQKSFDTLNTLDTPERKADKHFTNAQLKARRRARITEIANK